MLDFLIYDLKVAALIAVFYMFYRLMLAKETFHRINRWVLIATAVASFVLPLCVITLHETVVIPMPEASVEIGDAVIERVEPSVPKWQVAVPILFIIGMAVTLGHTFWSIFRIMHLIKRSEQHSQTDGTTICVTDNAAVAPFSWMHYIVMNRSDYELQDVAILAHEREHIRLHHSLDVLLVDTLTALQWFNPAMWMLRSDLRAIHEYEADAAVLSHGINARQYQYLLITKAAGIGGYSIANGITHSTLKNRIAMMLHTKSHRSSLLKLLALLPIVGITLALNAESVTDVVYQQPQKKIIKKGKKNATTQIGNMEVVVTSSEQETVEPDKTIKVRGQVYCTDDMQPIVGVVVRVAGTKKGTVTDREGRFTLEVSDQDQLEFMYVGMKTTKQTARQCQEYMQKTGQECLIPMSKEQESTKEERGKAFDVVEQMPQFPGGPTALMEFFSTNIHYPKEAHEKNIQGRVIVTFVVNKDGSISDPVVNRSIDPLLDAEALRVISSMPNWTPGKQNGEPVNVKYTVPVTFKLTGNNEAKEAEKYILEIDGKVVDDSEIANIPSGDVESMEVVKAQNGQPKKILITTKKKK